MLPIYLFCLLVGGGLVLLSQFGGDHGHDAAHTGFETGHGHDFSHVQGGGAPQGADFLLVFLNLRFWIYALACFGLIGLVLTLGTGQASRPILITSIVTGLIGGYAVSWLYQFAMRSDMHSNIEIRDLVGTLGRVTVALRPGEPGRIETHVGGETIELLAYGKEPNEIPRGSDVRIVDIEGGRAYVVSHREESTD